MNNFEEIIQICCKEFSDKDMLKLIVIWKEEENWNYYKFFRKFTSVLELMPEDVFILYDIKDKNSNAIILQWTDFLNYEKKSLESITAEINKNYINKNDEHNIGTFLKKYKISFPSKQAGDSLKSIMQKLQKNLMEKEKEISQCTLQALGGERPMIKEEIIKIMESQLQLLSDFGDAYTVKEICKISEQMLNISKFLLDVKCEKLFDNCSI